jgi:hypothetical protein
MRIAAIILAAVLVTGCGTTGHAVITGINTAESISNVTRAGAEEELLNCASDWFDPANRGSGCNR